MCSLLSPRAGTQALGHARTHRERTCVLGHPQPVARGVGAAAQEGQVEHRAGVARVDHRRELRPAARAGSTSNASISSSMIWFLPPLWSTGMSVESYLQSGAQACARAGAGVSVHARNDDIFVHGRLSARVRAPLRVPLRSAVAQRGGNVSPPNLHETASHSPRSLRARVVDAPAAVSAVVEEQAVARGRALDEAPARRLDVGALGTDAPPPLTRPGSSVSTSMSWGLKPSERSTALISLVSLARP